VEKKIDRMVIGIYKSASKMFNQNATFFNADWIALFENGTCSAHTRD
jgi:hypothetical protein